MKDPAETHVLAIDIGTSGIRASVYDRSSSEIPELKAKAETPFARDGSVRPEAEELLDAVFSVLDEAASNAESAGIFPQAVAVSCFWHSLLGMDTYGRPVTPVLTWADTSSERQVGRLRSLADERSAHNRTGCPFHSSYWPAKLLQLRESEPHVFGSAAKWLSFSDFLLQKVCGEAATGVSMASGTGLLDVRSCEWDNEMMAVTAVGREALPRILKQGEHLMPEAEARNRWPAFAGAFWIAPIGDGAANNVGAAATGSGLASLMIGTSGALRTVVDAPVPVTIPEGVFCYRLDEKRYCLGGALSDGGSLRKWLGELLGEEIQDEKIIERLEARGPDSHGLSFLPFVFGERSTGYHQGARGCLVGLTRGTDSVDVSIAALEGVAYRFQKILSLIEESTPVDSIVASGGSLESSPAWQRIIADVLGRRLIVHPSGGVSRRGAAIMALESCGVPIAVSGDNGRPILNFDEKRHEAYEIGRSRHERFYARVFGQKRALS